MKIAVVAVTNQGAALAQKIKQKLADEDLSLFVKKGSAARVNEADFFTGTLKELFNEIWSNHDAIICVMALGIVVRMVAPHLRDKRQDPAVIVLDEKGQYVISALSGHWGGANALAAKVGQLIGAQPVITTATDVNGLPAIEMVAREMGLIIENFPMVKRVNAAIVNGDTFSIYSKVPFNMDFPAQVAIKNISLYNPKEPGIKVVITNKILEVSSDTLVLRPQNLIVGVGCRRNTPKEKIIVAINEALAKSGCSVNSLRQIASIDIKQDEEGLLQAASDLQKPVVFFSKDEIKGLYATEVAKELSFSEFVYKELGVGGVCEAVTLLSSREAKLILKKMKMEGVTVAVAEVN